MDIEIELRLRMRTKNKIQHHIARTENAIREADAFVIESYSVEFLFLLRFSGCHVRLFALIDH